MNKTKVIVLVAIILLGLGGLGGWIVYSFTSQLTDVSEAKSLDDSFTNVVIHTDKAWLDIRPTEEKTPEVELIGQIHKSASYSFDAKVENDVLTISVNESSGSPWDFIFPTHLNAVIYLPEKQYNSLQLEVGGNHGEIHMEGLEIEEIQCKTGSSGIGLKEITAKNIALETSSAPIILTDINSDTITTKTYSGETQLKNVDANAIMAEATSGQVMLSTSHIDRQIDLETTSGEILVQGKREPKNVRFEVVNESGTVNLLDGRYIGGTRIGDGEHTVRLATKSGSIIVEMDEKGGSDNE